MDIGDITVYCHYVILTQVALVRAINHSDLPLWLEGLSLPGSHLIRTSPEKDGDLIRLTFAKDDPVPSEGVWLGGVVAPLLEMAVSVVGRLLGREMCAAEQPSEETLSRYVRKYTLVIVFWVS